MLSPLLMYSLNSSSLPVKHPQKNMILSSFFNCIAVNILPRSPCPFHATWAQLCTAPDRFAPDRFAPDRFDPDRFALNRIAPDRFALDRIASDRIAPDRFALDRSALYRSALYRFA